MQRLIEKAEKNIHSFDWLKLFGTLISILNVCIFMHKITRRKKKIFLVKNANSTFFHVSECVCVFARTFFVNIILPTIILLTTKPNCKLLIKHFFVSEKKWIMLSKENEWKYNCLFCSFHVRKQILASNNNIYSRFQQ